MEYLYYNVKKLEKYSGTKKIYLYPGGKKTRELLTTIEDKDVFISGIIDKERKIVNGYETLRLSDISENDSIIFITSRECETELRQELIQNSYRGLVESFFGAAENVKNGELNIKRMDLVLTSRCTLRCSKCANLMQYYSKPEDVEFGTIIKSMTNLLNVVDAIGQVYVLGGEPFLYKKLGEIIDFLKIQRKIKEIIIVTNGTLCPNDDNLWKKLSDKNVKIHISNYGELSRKKHDILDKCKKYYINCDVDEVNTFYDTGSMKRRNRSEQELNKVFIDCSTQCRSLYNGEFHFCPRSAHGVDLGLIPQRAVDYVDLINVKNTKLLKDELCDFINRKTYIEACDFCDIRIPGYYEHEYPAAEQAKEVLRV